MPKVKVKQPLKCKPPLPWKRVANSLRKAREECGFSLRELETLTGILHTEIFKIESGEQDCRLTSFLSLFVALGLPPGLVIDDLLAPSFAGYIQPVKDDETFPALVANLKAEIPLHSALAMQVAALCAAAVHLILCADPVRKARLLDGQKSTAVKRGYQDFAKMCAGLLDPLERLSLLKDFECNPVTALRKHKLLDKQLLKGMILDWNKQDNLEGIPLFLPFIGRSVSAAVRKVKSKNC